MIDGAERRIEGVGNGPIAAFVDALQRECDIELTVVDYREHAIGAGADAQATAYVEIRDAAGATLYGVGIDGEHRHRIPAGGGERSHASHASLAREIAGLNGLL